VHALEGIRPGTAVALEATGSWYWVADEVEQAGLVPKLVHARKAKLMLGAINKTDRLDALGLLRLQKTGTLPTVWIPPGELRDQRDLPRVRAFLGKERTRLKNRIHAQLTKYGLGVSPYSDAFGVRGREELRRRIAQLPKHTRFVTEVLVEQLEVVQAQIERLEERIHREIAVSEEVRLLMTLPGVGRILGVVMALEIGEVRRFCGPEKLAAYAGVTPRVAASGGKVRYGRMRSDVNQYLKWAFVEAANVVALHARRRKVRHVDRLYLRVRTRRNHYKAVGAVARHLAEAAYYVLKRREPYREPRGSLSRSASAVPN